MHRVGLWAAVAVLTFFPARGRAELFFTAEVAPTIGLAGFDTYRITATSDLGNVVGFDFSEIGSYGVFGPVNQVNPFGQPTIFPNSISLSGLDDPSQNTQFLIDANDVASVFTSESNNSLHGVFALLGDKQLTIGNSVPFLQITTAAASDVLLKGAFAILRPNNQRIAVTFDITLSDILVGPAPTVEIVPVPEPVPDPVVPPPPPPPSIDPNPVPEVRPEPDPGMVITDPPQPDPLPEPFPENIPTDPTPGGSEIIPESNPLEPPFDTELWRRNPVITFFDWKNLILDGENHDRDWLDFGLLPISGSDVESLRDWPIHAFQSGIAVDGSITDIGSSDVDDTNFFASNGIALISAFATDNIALASVPEPTTIWLLVFAEFAAMSVRRRNRLNG